MGRIISLACNSTRYGSIRVPAAQASKQAGQQPIDEENQLHLL